MIILDNQPVPSTKPDIGGHSVNIFWMNEYFITCDSKYPLPSLSSLIPLTNQDKFQSQSYYRALKLARVYNN